MDNIESELSEALEMFGRSLLTLNRLQKKVDQNKGNKNVEDRKIRETIATNLKRLDQQDKEVQKLHLIKSTTVHEKHHLKLLSGDLY